MIRGYPRGTAVRLSLMSSRRSCCVASSAAAAAHRVVHRPRRLGTGVADPRRAGGIPFRRRDHGRKCRRTAELERAHRSRGRRTSSFCTGSRRKAHVILLPEHMDGASKRPAQLLEHECERTSHVGVIPLTCGVEVVTRVVLLQACEPFECACVESLKTSVCRAGALL